MANIDEYLRIILNGVYGKDVRKAIHDGIRKCYDDNSASPEQVEAIVTQWLEDHPEATTTVDYEITTKVFENVERMKADNSLSNGDKCLTLGYFAEGDGGGAYYLIVDNATTVSHYETLSNGLFAELIIFETSVVNVRQAGAYGDGSADNTDLFNELAQHYDLYIPKGVYLISDAIELNGHNLFGDGINRQFSTANQNKGTVIKATAGDYCVEILDSCDIRDVQFICNDGGIHTNFTGYNRTFTCDNVVVSNVNTIGINCEGERSSRAIKITNTYVYGKALAISTGVKIGGSLIDNTVESCEIMGVQTGIVDDNGILRIVNTHIWTGCLNEVDEDDWWSNTIGIVCNNQSYFTNVYIDSSHIGIYVNTYNPVAGENLLFYSDTSMQGSSANDGVCVYTVFSNNTSIALDNVTILDRGYFKKICNKIGFLYPNIKITNVRTYSTQTLLPSTEIFPNLGNLDASDEFSTFIDGSNLVEICDADISSGGSAVFHVQLGITIFDVLLNTSASPVVKYKDVLSASSINVYYDNSVTGRIKIYIQNYGTASHVLTVKRCLAGYISMTKYGCNYDTNTREQYTIPRLTSTDGLARATT